MLTIKQTQQMGCCAQCQCVCFAMPTQVMNTQGQIG